RVRKQIPREIEIQRGPSGVRRSSEIPEYQRFWIADDIGQPAWNLNKSPNRASMGDIETFLSTSLRERHIARVFHIPQVGWPT
ncbi:MAG: hypothetical protein ACI38B_07000, partial [Bifidobacterium sp.]|uniref:hypothetical protein n=1 Tax=Bifidobacterium sp. TaxID=41200 RepID=UPI003F062592